MEIQAVFGSFALLCFVNILREICIEKYKEFNGVNFSSTRAMTKVIASFEGQQFMLRALARKHCAIEIRGSTFLDPNHLLNHGLKIDLNFYSVDSHFLYTLG